MTDTQYYEEIVTKRMSVVDDEGRTRSVVGCLPTGQNGIVLYDEAQKERVHVSTTRFGAGVSIKNNDENVQIGLYIYDTNGSVSLSLTGEDGKHRAGMYALKDGTTFLNLSGEDGKQRAGMHTLKDGTTILNLNSRAGEPKAVVGVHEDEPYIYLGDGSFVAMKHGAGQGSTVLGVNSDGKPILAFFDKEGNVTHKVLDTV